MADEPTIKVEIALASAPLAASPTWTDVSAYFVSASINRGRNRELDRYQAGTMTMVLRNEDRRFDPLYASGAYNPNIKPMKRIRVTATWNAVDYVIYDGYIDSWKQAYDIPNVATVEINATDLFKALAALEVPSSVYVAEVQADTPLHWWRLGDAAGSTSATASAGLLPLAVSGSPTFGSAGLVTRDADGAVLFTGGSTALIAGTGLTDVAAGVGAPFTMELIAKTSATPVNATQLLRIDSPAVGGAGLILIGSSDATNVGKVGFFTQGGATFESMYSTVRIDDGIPHHIAATQAAGGARKLYVDGVDVTGTTTSSVLSLGSTLGVWIGNDNPSSPGLGSTPGTIDEVALYASVLSAARIAAHSAARATPWNGDSPATRAGRIADLVGVPAGLRNFDTGSSVLQSTDLGGTALDALQKVTESEFGDLFITAAGVLRLIGRTGLLNIASSATFGDSGAELGYVDLVPDYSDQLIRNKVTISRDNGVAQTSSDATSVTNYLTHSYVLDGLQHNSDALSKDAADFYVAIYKDPISRITAIDVAPRGDPTNLWPHVLGRELNDRLTVNRRPQGGTVNSQISVIEGVKHAFSAKEWKTSWQLSPAYANTATVGFLQLDLASGPGLDSLRLYF